MMANAIHSYAYPSKLFFIQLQITFEKHTNYFMTSEHLKYSAQVIWTTFMMPIRSWQPLVTVHFCCNEQAVSTFFKMHHRSQSVDKHEDEKISFNF